MPTNVQIIAELKAFLKKASENRQKYCCHERVFTRSRKLSFEIVVLFITNLIKKSLAIELDHFFTFINEKTMPTKGAFSQARYKLKALFFQDWNQHLITTWSGLKAHSMKRWKGFQLCAMDGTTALLPNRPEIMKVFGSHLNQAGSFALAQVMVCYDVLNGFCLKSKIASAHADELSTALKWINHLPDKTLTLYDRGYASFALIYLHSHFRRAFLLRCQTNFNKTIRKFVNSNRQTAIVTFIATTASQKRLQKLNLPCDQQASVKVRLIKVKLSTGQTEVLITSLLDQEQFPTVCFGQLYCFRWGVETYYDRLKNQLQLEVFTGHKAEAIYQEFYAMIFVTNLQALLVEDCQDELREANQYRKYDHQINYNVALGLMKNQTITLFLEEKPTEIYRQLKKKFLKHTEAIRPNRSYPRDKRRNKRRGKYQTWSNYRRAM